MRKLHVIPLILVLLGWSILCFSQTNSLPPTPIFKLADNQIRQALPPLKWIIEEGENPLSVEDIRKGNLKDAKVIHLVEGEKTLLLEDKSYWYRINLQSEVPRKNMKLSANFIGLDGGFIFTFKNVDAYTFINNQLIKEGISGLGVGRSQRDVKDIYEESMVNIEMNDQTSSKVWVKIRPYLNAAVIITNDVIASGGEHYYPKGAGSIPYPRPGWGDIMYYPSIGALAVFLLIGLFLFYWFREKVYGWFLTFILVNILAVWCIGFGNEFISSFCPENPLVAAKYRELSDVLKFAVTLWFGRIFINTPKYFPKTDTVFVILILILPLASFSWVFFIGAGIGTNNISGLAKGINALLNLTSLFNLIILLYFIFSKNKLARIYSLGVILTFVGFFMVRSSINWVYQLAVLFIVLGSILALGLALVYRFKVMAEERLQAEQEKKAILSNQNTLLEKEVKERTAELVEKNQELEIETALERVRASSMAMHQSSELENVLLVVFDQLKKLGFNFYQAWMNIVHLEEGYLGTWLSPVVGINNKPYYAKIPLAPFKDTLFKAWQEGKPFSYLSVTNKEEINQFGNLLSSITGNPIFKEHLMKLELSSFEIIEFNHKYGKLGINQKEKATVEEENVLKRFGKVFEQTYTRFLDLQKAEAQAKEAQAKEAQIEAALERVRAQTMAMHKSEELSQVVTAMFQEFQQLGLINEVARTTINFIDEENGNVVTWLTGLGGEEISNKFEYSIFGNELWEAEFYAYKKLAKDKRKEHKYINTFEGKEFEELIAFALDKKLMLSEENKILEKKGIKQWIEHNVYFAYGCLNIQRPMPLPDDAFYILQRFVAVFEQTYTRFLDLQKAEAQAQAIEKVFNENQRLLHSILPEPIAEQIRQGQQTVVKRFEEVSILFADIVGFTILSEKLSPQKVVDILNGLFSKFDDLTDKYGLEKIKTIGDAYMVASGVPEERDNHALVLFQFAQEMLQAIQTFNQVHQLSLEIRIGISSGPVVAGVIGKKKFAYDLWGDTVNTAARMEAYGQASCIQLSPTSYEILKNDFEFEKISNVEIKGKGLMDVWSD